MKEEVDKIINYFKNDNWYTVFDAEECINLPYKLLSPTEVKQIMNYINQLETKLELKKDQDIQELKLKDGSVVGTWETGSNYCYTLSAPQMVLLNKINELIKEVNKLKHNEEVL